MIYFIFRRLLTLIPLLLAIALLVFLLMYLAPGDFLSTARANRDISKEFIAQMEQEFGLDRPWYVQYGLWLENILPLRWNSAAEGGIWEKLELGSNFGYSWTYKVPVTELLAQRIPATLALAATSLLFAWGIAIPLGGQQSLGRFLQVFQVGMLGKRGGHDDLPFDVVQGLHHGQKRRMCCLQARLVEGGFDPFRRPGGDPPSPKTSLALVSRKGQCITYRFDSRRIGPEPGRRSASITNRVRHCPSDSFFHICPGTRVHVLRMLTLFRKITPLPQAGVQVMGITERRERQRRELRNAILSAAEELFVEEGFENVSMRKIARRIEYSPTTIYRFFESKAEIMNQLIAAGYAGVYLRYQRVFAASNGSPRETLNAIIRAYVEFAIEHPNHYELWFTTSALEWTDGQLRMSHGDVNYRVYHTWIERIEDCRAEGRFAGLETLHVFQLLWGAVHGLISLRIHHPAFPWLSLDRHVDQLLTMIEEGLH